MTNPTNPLGVPTAGGEVDLDAIEADLAARQATHDQLVADVAVRRLAGQAEAQHTAPPAANYSLREQAERELTPAPVATAPRAHGVTIEEAERLRAEAEAAESEDFERFWDGRKRKAPKALRNVLGVDLVLPDALPLQFEIESRRLQDSSDPRDVARLFDLLFGHGRYDELVVRGLDADRFGVILMWGTLNGNGIDFSLAEAHAKCEEMKASQGKALIGRAMASGPTSSGTGDTSRPTSPASTASPSPASQV